MGIFFQVFIITIWLTIHSIILKRLTNQGYYAYLTKVDMCDMGKWGWGDLGK